MKKELLFLLLFVSSGFTLFAQTCPLTSGTGGTSAVRWLSSGLLTINWDAVGEGTTMYNALASSGVAITMTGFVSGGTNDGAPFSLSLPASDWSNPNAQRIRPANTADGNNGEAAQFTGTIVFNLQSGGPETCVYQAGVLPLQLVEFKANLQNEVVHVYWQSASELNSDMIIVQRSIDGTDWEDLGLRKAAGYSTESIDYHFEDSSPLKGVNYYRLKQVDLYGGISFSHVEQVNFESPISMLPLLPNSVSKGQSATIDLSDWNNNPVSVYVFTISGQLVSVSHQHLDQIFSIETSNLESGQYLVKVTNGNKSQQAKLFVH